MGWNYVCSINFSVHCGDSDKANRNIQLQGFSSHQLTAASNRIFSCDVSHKNLSEVFDESFIPAALTNTELQTQI
jgi:hypothetical protein